jgi:hypothetical protein
MHITKKFQSAAQSSGHVKIFYSEQKQVRAAVKKLGGTLFVKNTFLCVEFEVPLQLSVSQFVRLSVQSCWDP